MASLRDALSGMEQSVDNLISRLTSASSTMSGSGGRIRTGSNFLNNGLAAFSTTPSVRGNAQFQLGMGVVRGAGQVASGVSQMMPQVSVTMDRMASSYGATLRAGGGMSRNQLQEQTLAGLNGGLTSAGADARVSNFLAMQGVSASSPTFGQITTAVGNAGKYLNMSNERSAAALEGLTGGATSASFLRNFGMSTADPRTGKTKTQGQIFGELYGRLTAGRGVASEEQVMDSFRRGTLGATLRGSGMTNDQQQMFVQYAVERARGNNMDLNDPEAMQTLMDKAKAEGNENPNLPGYELNTAQTNSMQSAQEAYLAGIKAVVGPLSDLTEMAGEAAGALGGFKSGLGMIGGNPVAQGFGQVVGGAGGVLASAAALGLATKGGRGFVSKAFKGATSRLGGGGGGKGGLKKVGGVLGVGAGAVGTATSIGGAYETAKSGGNAMGDILGAAGSGALTGASIGMFAGPKGALVGAAIGGLVGGIGGGIGAISGAGAEGGDQGDSNTNGSGAPQQFKLMHPTKSAKIGAGFGRRESFYTPGKIIWPNGHKGIDYQGDKGDAIFASESGYATLHSGGQLGTRVRIKHSNGMYTHYCHLDSTTVREGQVTKGTPIGRMGNTGSKSTGVHLHFALSTGPDTSSAIDPAPYLTGGGNQLQSGPQDADQSSSGANPTSAGTTSASSNPGSEDSSPVSAAASTNRSSGTVKNVPTAPGGTGTSSASGVEPYSSGSHYSSGGGANTAAAPEGGENTSDAPGYLSASNGRPRSTAGSSKAGSVTTNNVTINVSIAKGSPDEAKKFANMLKQALEDEQSMKMMARN